MSKPKAIDFFCGLGGWAEGLLACGYEVIGYDIERHDYGTGGYPSKLILQDVTTLHGSQFKDVALFVASPPCQKYSYMAMPWSRAKKMAADIRADKTGQSKRELTLLFDTCFRIQREASEAAGRHIPMVVENVRGAQEWVGDAAWHYGSFYLWGDVPALMPQTKKIVKFGGSWTQTRPSHTKDHSPNHDGRKGPGGDWFENGRQGQDACLEALGFKSTGHANIRDGHTHTRHLTNQRESDGVKFSQSGDAWFDGKPRDKMLGDKGPAAYGSSSRKRKMASAMIAKIPFPLAYHIGQVYYPKESAHG